VLYDIRFLSLKSPRYLQVISPHLGYGEKILWLRLTSLLTRKASAGTHRSSLRDIKLHLECAYGCTAHDRGERLVRSCTRPCRYWPVLPLARLFRKSSLGTSWQKPAKHRRDHRPPAVGHAPYANCGIVPTSARSYHNKCRKLIHYSTRKPDGSATHVARVYDCLIILSIGRKPAGVPHVLGMCSWVLIGAVQIYQRDGVSGLNIFCLSDRVDKFFE
jgi:hypothetical protein